MDVQEMLRSVERCTMEDRPHSPLIASFGARMASRRSLVAGVMLPEPGGCARVDHAAMWLRPVWLMVWGRRAPPLGDAHHWRMSLPLAVGDEGTAR